MLDGEYGPQGERFFRRARRELVPKLRDSAVFLSLYSESPDPKYCMELGMAIAMDKPIIIVVAKGRKIGEHLRRVADEVIEDVDFNDPAEKDRVQGIVAQVLNELGETGETE